MKLVKIGAAVLNQTPLDWAGNRDNILAAIEHSRERLVSVLCFPELAIPGYGCEDAFHSPGVWKTSLDVLREILPHTHGMVVSLGLPILYKNGLFNCAALCVDAQLVGLTAKRHLAGDGIYYEPRWFKPWPQDVAVTIEIDGRDVPLGDIHYEVGGVKLGFEICEDAWVAQRPGSGLSGQGVDIILNPSASHFAFGKFDIRKRFVLEGSRSFGVTYVYANLVGNDSGRILYDGGALIATRGTMVAVGPRFGYEPFYVTAAVIDVDASRMTQVRTGSFQPSIASDPDCIEWEFSFPELDLDEDDPEDVGATLAPWEKGPSLQEEEFARAIALALFDYMRKSRARGFVVSLSGGADSAAVSVLSALSVHFAMAELGEERFWHRLGLPESTASCRAGTVTTEPSAAVPGRAAASGAERGTLARPAHGADAAAPDRQARAAVAQLLTCAYQATRNSSETTRNAARAVAEALGATYHELDVDAQVEAYCRMIEGAIGRPLSWQTDDLALQNIQARVRAPGIWMLANLAGALLLATSNRSEAAVGYATMDGDTCGGLSPIAGIDKDFLRRWLRWCETVGPHGHGPIPALQAVNVQQPTAELRPLARAQTDEGDLMPYAILDEIEDAAIGEKRMPLEVWRELRHEHPEEDPEQLARWVERFFRLWCRNQWKRERYAPSFHVDDKNLDPKTWCRFPILSGGFERELAELRLAAGIVE